MTMACPTLSTGDAFLSTLLRHIDCQAQTLGSVGYQSLADPGAPLSMALSALLTVFIALFGLRMVLGETPSLRDGVMAVVKIGIVLLIATSWPAYRTVIYDVVIDGPGQLTAAIGRPAGLPGAEGDLIGRLQITDSAITRLTTLGSGRNDLVSRPPANEGEPQREPLADDPAFGSARVLFLSATIAAFAIVRLTAGLLLALAPLFAGLLLFDMAHGIFVGWLRALIFSLLASLAVSIILGVELALLEPWLSQMLQLRQVRIVTAAAPIELLVICLAFALALAGSLAVILRLAFTLHLSVAPRREAAPAAAAEPPQVMTAPSERPELQGASPRALAVAGALAAAQRRERASAPSLAVAQQARSMRTTFETADGFAIPAYGRALRRARPRKSIGAALRDRRS